MGHRGIKYAPKAPKYGVTWYVFSTIYSVSCRSAGLRAQSSIPCFPLWLQLAPRYPSITETIPPEFPSLKNEFSKLENQILTRQAIPDGTLPPWQALLPPNLSAGPAAPGPSLQSCQTPMTGANKHQSNLSRNNESSWPGFSPEATSTCLSLPLSMEVTGPGSLGQWLVLLYRLSQDCSLLLTTLLRLRHHHHQIYTARSNDQVKLINK